MSKGRIQTVLTVFAVGVGLLIAFVVGLFTYMNATATPLHPDPLKVQSVTQSEPSARWAEAIGKARELIRTEVTRQNLPGASAAVGIGSDIVWAEGFGFSNLEKRTTVTPATKFRIAEVSIPLTSAAVGLLLEKNTLNLDNDIQAYVPEFPEKQWPVTLRQAMSHTAGIRGDAGDEEPLLERCDRTADGLKRFSQDPLRFEPGTQYRSSSYGWILVSAAVEAAAGEPFFTFMRTRIFEPLGMVSTRPDAWKEAIPDRSTFYYPRFAGDTRYGPQDVREGDQTCFAGAGAFLSTPIDLVRFGMALGSGKLLKPETVQLLQTRQRLTSGEDTDYGLGWKLETVDLAGTSARMAGHGTKQDFMGGTAYLMTFPERGMAVAVTANISFADMKSVALKIAQTFAAQEKNAATR